MSTADGDWTLTAEAVERWAVEAKPGDRLVYCRGHRLGRTPGVEAISRLHDEGEVILNYRAVGSAGGEWLATRRAEPARVDRRHQVLRKIEPEPDRDELVRTLAVLKRWALVRRPCGTNREIARLADLSGPDQAAYQLRKLISGKIIRVDTDSEGFRVVTIVATGRTTRGRE